MNLNRNGTMARLPDRLGEEEGWMGGSRPGNPNKSRRIQVIRSQSSRIALNRAKPIDLSCDAPAEQCSALHVDCAQPSAYPVCALRLSKKLVSIRAIRVKAFFPTPKMHRALNPGAKNLFKIPPFTATIDIRCELPAWTGNFPAAFT